MTIEIKIPCALDDVRISVFENATSTKPRGSASIHELLSLIKTPPDMILKQIENLRLHLLKGEEEKYKQEKKELNAVTISGTFFERKAADLIDHSGILQIDIDKVENPSMLRDKIAQDQHIISAFLSPSNQGVKALMLIPADHTLHNEIFLAAEKYFEEHYNVQVDKSCKDVGRLMFVSFDPDLKTNPNAIPFKLPEGNLLFDADEFQDQCFSLQTEGETADRLQSALQVLSAEKYEDWIKYGHALKGWNGSGAFNIWQEWSSTASTFKDNNECASKWASFSPSSGIDERAIFRAAIDTGWEMKRECNYPLTPNVSLADNGLEERQKKLLKVEGWPEPLPLPKAPPPPPSLSPSILPEPLAEYARVTALENEASPEAVAAFLLSSIGAVTGTRFCIRPDYRKMTWYEFPVRSAGLVMNVSENKSGVFKAGIGPLTRLQKSYKKKNDEILAINNMETAIFNKKKSGLLKRLEKLQEKGEEEKKIQAVESQIKELQEPEKTYPKVISITTGTREKILEMLSHGNERGLMIKRDELSGFFADLTRDGKDGDRQFFIEAMTVAYSYDHNTISRGTDLAELLAVSVCGTIQKSKVRRLLREMEQQYKDDGLLQRFMWVCPKQVNYNDFDEEYQKGFRGIDSDLFSRTQTLFEKLDALTPIDIGATEAVYSPAPWIVFDDHAQTNFFTWRKFLKEEVLTDENLSDGLIAHLSKSERLVSGLALSFHAVKCAVANNINEIPKTIDSDSLNRAIDIWDILRKHAEAFYNMEYLNTIEATHLFNSRLGKFDDVFSVSDVKQKRWKGLKDEKAILEVMDLLSGTNRILEIEPPKIKRGRPLSRRFKINPKVRNN